MKERGGGRGRRKAEEGKRMRRGKVNGKMEGRECGKTRAEKRRGEWGGGGVGVGGKRRKGKE